MTTLPELQQQVLDAVERAEPLCIVAGNSKRHLGRDPVGRVIELGDYAGVVDYEPTELVITVRAGTRITDLQAVLAEQQQTLACDPPVFDGRATVGGTLACCQSGPARPWVGSIRDQVLGVRLINGKGEQLRFGGQVMKNVAGYDLSRLQAGAMGAFGLLTEVSLRVLPKPRSSITVTRSLDADEAVQAMSVIGKTPAPLSGAAWHAGKLYLRLSGEDPVVEAAAAHLEGERLVNDGAFWESLRDQTLPWFMSANNLWRFSVRASSPHALPQEDWLLDWGGAQRWLSGDHDHDELQQLASDLRGEVTRIRGGDREAERLPTVSPGKRTLLTRIKQAFDPAGVFNPGRLYSWM